MPVVLTDKTNAVWAVDDPTTGLLLVGKTGQRGYKVSDLLSFIEKREKQFTQFIRKKEVGKLRNVRRVYESK